MSKKLVASFLSVSAAALALLARPLVRAADHEDSSPGLTMQDPAADLTDVFAWMSPDTSDVYLILPVLRRATPSSRFSDRVQHILHTTSKASFSAAAATEYNILCEFDSAQAIRCWAGDDEFVEGDATTLSGIESESGRFKVFAGLRNDAFFFNGSGFQRTTRLVVGAAPTLPFDPAGCPSLTSATSAALVAQLRSSPTGGAPADAFARHNVLAIVIAIDKTLVTRGGPIVGVYATTNRKS